MEWFPASPRTIQNLKKNGFHQRPFLQVWNFNHLKMGTVILIVFDFLFWSICRKVQYPKFGRFKLHSKLVGDVWGISPGKNCAHSLRFIKIPYWKYDTISATRRIPNPWHQHADQNSWHLFLFWHFKIEAKKIRILQQSQLWAPKNHPKEDLGDLKFDSLLLGGVVWEMNRKLSCSLWIPQVM